MGKNRDAAGERQIAVPCGQQKGQGSGSCSCDTGRPGVDPSPHLGMAYVLSDPLPDDDAVRHERRGLLLPHGFTAQCLGQLGYLVEHDIAAPILRVLVDHELRPGVTVGPVE